MVNDEYSVVLEDAIARLNNEYKKILESKEYLLGRKICKLVCNLRSGDLKNIYTAFYMRRINRKKGFLSSKGYRWISDIGEIQIDSPVIIYTCITGGYSHLEEPLYRPKDVKFIAFVDFDLPVNSLWEKIDINAIKEIQGMDPTRVNRYIKLHPHKFFKEYEYSIYVDSNIKVVGNMKKYISCIGKRVPIAANWHPSRYCLYSEARACMIEKKDSPNLIMQQIHSYRETGMPENFGLIEGGILIRKHNDLECVRVMENWWKELCIWSKRDQISFPYALWKTGYTMKDIGFISKNLRKINEITIFPHGGLEIK